MRSYHVCLSLPGLVHTASCPLVHPCCHKSWLPSVSRLNNSTYVCSTPSYPPSIHGHLGGFRVLTAVANAAVNMGVQVPCHDSLLQRLHLLHIKPRRGLAGSVFVVCGASCCFPARLRQHRSCHASSPWPWTTPVLDFTARSHPSSHSVSTSRHSHGPCSRSATSLP